MMQFWKWLGALVGVTLLMTMVLTWQAYTSVAKGNQPGYLLHPRILKTPFSITQGVGPARLAADLGIQIYPGSAVQMFGTGGEAPSASAGSTSWSLLTAQAPADLHRVDEWYQSHLGSGAKRSAEVLPAIQAIEDNRLRVPSVRDHPVGISFEHTEGQRRETLVLEALAEDVQQTQIVHFDCVGARCR
jgi:hypothetical protein